MTYLTCFIFTLGEWANTGGENLQPFLIYDSRVNVHDRVVVFGTDATVWQLGSAPEWYMDGTWMVCSAFV